MKKNIRKFFKSAVNNYFEIFIDAKINEIKNKNLKKTYKNFKSNIVGHDIKPEFPQNPDVIIKNNLNKNINNLTQELIKKISKFKFKSS